MSCVRSLAAFAALLVVVAACSHAARAPEPSPSPPRRTPVLVRVTPSPSPTPSPTPAPVALWTASPSPAPHRRAKRRDRGTDRDVALPRIYAILVNAPAAGNGDVIAGSVRTSANVVGVHLQIAGFGVDLPKTGAGTFAMQTRLANVPFFVRGTFPVVVTARDAKGDTVQRTVSFTIK